MLTDANTIQSKGKMERTTAPIIKDKAQEPEKTYVNYTPINLKIKPTSLKGTQSKLPMHAKQC